jgi:threonyl-tRNA synthetase
MHIEAIRHSLAHIMATAVQELYPGTKFGIGPAIEKGFYYDVSAEVRLNDLPKIEKKMQELIRQNIRFEKRTISKAEAKRIFQDQPYKLELIKEMPGKTVLVYQSGDFIDLCKGPHVKSTKEIRPEAFKLIKVAGAYWRGSEKNPMLTRIYGLAFSTKKELDRYLEIQKEAEKRDHRKLGSQLDLFHIDEEFGAGLPLWHPKGASLRKIIEDYLVKEHLQNNYQILSTPHVAHLSLWKTTGHWDFYRENLYPPMQLEGEDYIVKPMNCPGHILIYKTKIRSYKELPLRWFELGTVYRYEKSGVLHGLTRVRGFTQDDAHIFCTPDQLSKELVFILQFGLRVLKTFGFKNFDVYLSTRPKKYVGTLNNWEKATNSLKYALEKVRLPYQIDPGEGVFYGPKIDIKIKDCLGRPWQCTTVQVDFNLPERLQVTYIDQKGKKQRPIMIHRALLGSIERFVGVLLEHYAGALPLWLAPLQIWIIPLGSRHQKYAKEIAKKLQAAGFRLQIKDENETISKKIREGELQKIPYLLVLGDKEMKRKSVRIRKRGKGDLGMVGLNKFLEMVKIELEKKS